MKQFLLLTVVFALGNAKHLDYRVQMSQSAETPQCTRAGLLCESCTNLVACVFDQESNIFTKTKVEACPSGQKCVRGVCTADADPYCDGVADLAFPCQAAGIFPDPFYCNKFVMCAEVDGKLKAFPSKCEDGLGYNIGTGLCDIVLKNGACVEEEYPIPLCNELGEAQALPNKPQEYYTCKEYSPSKKVLYPFIDACPQAAKFSNYMCQ